MMIELDNKYAFRAEKVLSIEKRDNRKYIEEEVFDSGGRRIHGWTVEYEIAIWLEGIDGTKNIKFSEKLDRDRAFCDVINKLNKLKG